MNELFGYTIYFGLFVTILGYWLGNALKKRFRHNFVSPVVIAFLAIIALLLVCGIDYEVYYEGAKYLSYFLTPATICLAIPLYEQLELLKKHIWAVIGGITAGIFASLVTILAIAWLFHLDHAVYASLLPKSITTAIGIAVSEELGGVVPLTVGAICLTGIVGCTFGEGILRLFRVTEPIAVGLALGTSAHAIATVRAMEIGKVEGAMSSLSIAVAGLLNVVGASLFIRLL